MCKILDWKGGGTSSRDSVMCFQDCMTWLTTVTQLGSVICKSFRPVDLTIGRAGFFGLNGFLLNVSEFRWCLINYIE